MSSITGAEHTPSDLATPMPTPVIDGDPGRFPPPRPWMHVEVVPFHDGHDPFSSYVRRYWGALIGGCALEDLLRLVAAAANGRRIRKPTHLHVLLAEGLAWAVGPTVVVPATIPPLPPAGVRRLPPPLRLRHAEEGTAPSAAPTDR